MTGMPECAAGRWPAKPNECVGAMVGKTVRDMAMASNAVSAFGAMAGKIECAGTMAGNSVSARAMVATAGCVCWNDGRRGSVCVRTMAGKVACALERWPVNKSE